MVRHASLTAALAAFGCVTAVRSDLPYVSAANSASNIEVAEGQTRSLGLAQAWKIGYIGTALTIRDDPIEQHIIQAPNDFDTVTPENAMKWEYIEPANNTFSFTDADRYADFARTYGKQLRCHTLVWHERLPAWVSNGNFDNATLLSIMENHIRHLAGRYQDVCTRWDVVNEALNEDGTLRRTIFYNTTGPAYIPIAFRLARQYSPKSKLFYNDYNLEVNPAKALGAQRLIRLIQSYGVQIDGIGLQAHLTVGRPVVTGGDVAPDAKTLAAMLRGFTEMGVDVAVTELDVRVELPVTKGKLRLQKEVHERVVRACVECDRCVGVTTWGLSDKYSWIPKVFPGVGAALMFDDKFQKKPAYKAVLDVLRRTHR